MPLKVMTIFGTRPEAIKMAPLIKQLEGDAAIESTVCVTGQHRSMLTQVLDLFEIVPQHDLAVMTGNQTLNGLASRLIALLDDVLAAEKPDRVLVHGDTTTASAAALAAFHRRIPIGHVEAGLRTGDLMQPWPEEMNRRVIDVMSDLMFAPTASSKANLAAERLYGRTIVTGNTVIDALYMTIARIDCDAALRAELDARLPFLDGTLPMLLVLRGARRPRAERGGADCLSGASESERPRSRSGCAWRCAQRPSDRSARLSRLCPVDATRIAHPDRFGRHSGRGTRARQTCAGDARCDRAPGSRRGGHRATGRHRPGGDPQCGVVASRAPGCVPCADFAQSVWRRASVGAHCGGARWPRVRRIRRVDSAPPCVAGTSGAGCVPRISMSAERYV
jgi:hypothetical protein